jgi:hypothetical protein
MPDGRKRDSVQFSIIDEEWPEVRRRLEEKLKVSSESELSSQQAGLTGREPERQA